MRIQSTLAAVILGFGLIACSKEAEAPAAEPAAPTAPESAASSDAPAAATAPAPAAPAAAEDPAVAAKRAAVEFALSEQKIAEDPLGQWAASATASSVYGDAADQASYSVWQATGAPNVQHYGDDGNSWATKEPDHGIEWLQVTFAQPAHATMLRIRQNNAPGTIIKLELLEEGGASHTVFEGVDSQEYAAGEISWFTQKFEATPYLVAGAKITLATNAVSGWNEIDAVQLVSAPAAGAAAPAATAP